MGFVVAVVPVWLHARGPRAGSAARPKGRRVWLSFGVGLHFMCQVVAVVLRHSLVTFVSCLPSSPPPHARRPIMTDLQSWVAPACNRLADLLNTTAVDAWDAP